MLVYTINRILYLIPVLFILTVVVFSFVHFLPGDVIDVLAGGLLIRNLPGAADYDRAQGVVPFRTAGCRH